MINSTILSLKTNVKLAAAVPPTAQQGGCDLGLKTEEINFPLRHTRAVCARSDRVICDFPGSIQLVAEKLD